MRQIFSNIGIVILVTGALVGCSPFQYFQGKDSTESIPEAPETQVLGPMEYRWVSNYSTMVTPPPEIREKALAACMQRGFDRAFMQSIAIHEDQATAYFSCRGSDQ